LSVVRLLGHSVSACLPRLLRVESGRKMTPADRLGDEAQRFLAHVRAGTGDYEVVLRNASSHSFFYLHVLYQGREIRQQAFWPPFQFFKARRFVRRVVRGHRRLLNEAAREGVQYSP
jgi:hypothetical protein